MTYDQCISWLQTIGGIPQNNEDENFQRIVPPMFLYAENRIYRELQFLAQLGTQTATLTANNRDFTLPASVLSLVSMVVCTPVGVVTNNTIRTPPLERIPAELIDFLWPQSSYKPGVPKKYALLGNLPTISGSTADLASPYIKVRLMPTPDRAYTTELFGRVQPTGISPDDPQTFLSIKYPELLLAACMVYITGYQRDYGAQSDDPQRAMSWEQQYTTLRQGVMLEAAQQRGEGPGWTAATPAPATQPRAP